MTGGARRVCSDAACGFVQRTNPTPAVGALVEYEGDIILARNVKWPEGWFALITGLSRGRGRTDSGRSTRAERRAEPRRRRNPSDRQLHLRAQERSDVVLSRRGGGGAEARRRALRLPALQAARAQAVAPRDRICGRGLDAGARSRGGIRRLSSVVVQAFSLLSRITKARRSRRYFFEKELLRVLRIFVKCRHAMYSATAALPAAVRGSAARAPAS